MLTPLQASCLMFLFPTYQPGETMKGAMAVIGLLGPQDELSEAGVAVARAAVQTALLERPGAISGAPWPEAALRALAHGLKIGRSTGELAVAASKYPHLAPMIQQLLAVDE